MYKRMNEKESFLPMNLQIFANEGDNNDDAGTDDGADNTTDNNDSGDDSGDDKTGDSGTGGKTFTQKEINVMMAREKKQGRAAALKSLGIDPSDTKTVALVKSIIASQTKQDSGDQTSEEVKQAKLEAEQAKAEVVALKLKAKPEFVEDLVSLAMTRRNDGEELKDVISGMKTKYPFWFADEKQSDDKDGNKKDDKNKDGLKGQKTGQRGTGSSLKGANDNNKDNKAADLGARLAAKKTAATSKKHKTLWG